MKNCEIIDDPSAMAGWFLLAITFPIWAPIIALGFVAVFPLMLLFLMADDFKEQKKINEGKTALSMQELKAQLKDKKTQAIDAIIPPIPNDLELPKTKEN